VVDLLKILKCEKFYTGIGTGRRGLLVVRNDAFILSLLGALHKTNYRLDLSLIFLMRKILKIFTAIE
jgi:hypothetical protein